MGQATNLAADLQPAVAVALAKSLAKATADVVLSPGLYTVDEVLTMRVVGTVKRQPDTEFTPPVRVPTAELVAAALEAAGVNRRDAKRAIEKAAAAVLTAGYAPANSDRARDVQDAVDAASEQVKAAAPKQPRAGATAADIRLELIQAAINAA